MSHSTIALTFWFCILLLTHADTDSLRTPWIPAQTEISLPQPPSCQAPRHGQDTLCLPTATAVLWRFPSSIPWGHHSLKSQTDFSNALHITHLPAQLSAGKQATLMAGSSQTTNPDCCHDHPATATQAGDTWARPALSMSLTHRTSASLPAQGWAGMPKSPGDTSPC